MDEKDFDELEDEDLTLGEQELDRLDNWEEEEEEEDDRDSEWRDRYRR
ncbi:MAG: hypothetical protein HC875_09150 [Anaerolineales bacterium]|nr:hypothetical protein [Anaerolineales bacterium]